MPNLVVSAVAKWNGTALKKAEKQLTQFQKTTNLLAKSFAAAFAVRKITQFGKASVQAFIADEKAAKSLSIALQNTGNDFATIATEGFIARLQDTYKVLDDDLRPAFQTLLTATSSITESQKALELALSISAGTGKDLGAVSMALAKGFSGQTTALSRLGAGLSKATLASGDMNAIMDELNSKFRGQALEATKTYAGQMAALGVAAANAKEIIGKGLLDSLTAIGGGSTQDGLQTTLKLIEDIATAAAKFNVNFGTGIGQAAALLRGDFATFKALGVEAAKKPAEKAAYSPTSMYFTVETAERAKLVSTIKKQNTTEKEKQKLSAAELADKKKQAELEALKQKFDVDRINLETALANSKDEAEKARIRSLLTIMDDDANGAAKRMAELDKTNADKMRSEYLAAVSLNNLAEAARLAAMGVATLTIGGVRVQDFARVAADPATSESLATATLIESEKALAEAQAAMERAKVIAEADQAEMTTASPTNYGYTAENPSFTYGAGNPNYNIVINTPLGSEDALTETVQRVMQKLKRFGDSETFAGAL
jgi:hypothetical protein